MTGGHWCTETEQCGRASAHGVRRRSHGCRRAAGAVHRDDTRPLARVHEVGHEVSDLREVKRWVMFWGTECNVLEPDELRRALVAEMRLLMTCYGGDLASPVGC